MFCVFHLSIQAMYELDCPRCKDVLYGMWFLQSSSDNHGIYSCSACVSWFARAAQSRRSTWDKIPSQKAICKHTKASWRESTERSLALVASVEEAEATAASKRKRRRKRRRKSSVPVPAPQHEEQSENAAAAPAASSSEDNTQWEKFLRHMVDAFKYQVLAACAHHDISVEIANKLTANIDLSGVKKP